MTREAEALYGLKDSTDPLEWGDHYVEVEMTDRDFKIGKVIDWFSDHTDEFVETIEELDSYNGYLGDDRYYYMEELDELYAGTEPTEILQRAFYGYDEDTWHTDGSGNKIREAFNPNREYFRFNGYGNLLSADYKDYSDHLDKYFVEEFLNHRDSLWLPPLDEEITKILDELEEK